MESRVNAHAAVACIGLFGVCVINQLVHWTWESEVTDVNIGHYGDRKYNLATKKCIADAMFIL